MQHSRSLIKPSLRSRTNRRQRHHHDHIPTRPMVLVYRLGIIHAAIHLRGVVLRQADNRLQVEQNVGNEPHNGVGGLEVCAACVSSAHDRGGRGKAGEGLTRPLMQVLVVYNHHQSRHERQDACSVEHGVEVRALLFLLGRVGWLE